MENINWSDLAFGYMKTDYNVRCYYRDGKWGELEVSSSEIINIHMAATCLHYGQGPGHCGCRGCQKGPAAAQYQPPAGTGH